MGLLAKLESCLADSVPSRAASGLMALGWLLLLHLLADLAVALYRCTAINPLLTDTFARGADAGPVSGCCAFGCSPEKARSRGGWPVS